MFFLIHFTNLAAQNAKKQRKTEYHPQISLSNNARSVVKRKERGDCGWRFPNLYRSHRQTWTMTRKTKTSQAVTDSSFFQEYTHMDDHTYEVTTGVNYLLHCCSIARFLILVSPLHTTQRNIAVIRVSDTRKSRVRGYVFFCMFTRDRFQTDP